MEVHECRLFRTKFYFIENISAVVQRKYSLLCECIAVDESEIEKANFSFCKPKRSDFVSS